MHALSLGLTRFLLKPVCLSKWSDLAPLDSEVTGWAYGKVPLPRQCSIWHRQRANGGRSCQICYVHLDFSGWCVNQGKLLAGLAGHIRSLRSFGFAVRFDFSNPLNWCKILQDCAAWTCLSWCYFSGRTFASGSVFLPDSNFGGCRTIEGLSIFWFVLIMLCWVVSLLY